MTSQEFIKFPAMNRNEILAGICATDEESQSTSAAVDDSSEASTAILGSTGNEPTCSKTVDVKRNTRSCARSLVASKPPPKTKKTGNQFSSQTELKYVGDTQRKIITEAILKAKDPALGGNEFFQQLTTKVSLRQYMLRLGQPKVNFLKFNYSRNFQVGSGQLSKIIGKSQ